MSDFPQLAMGQVQAVYPDEYAVEVVFPNLAYLGGVRVKVMAPGASARAGAFELPERGDWGIVFWYQNDWRSARWHGGLTDAFTNAVPLEAFSSDPDLRASFERSGRETWRHGSGDIEVNHPDGSLFRVTHSDDAPDKRTERKAGKLGPERAPERITYRKADKKRLQVYFEQKDRTRFSLDREGNAALSLTVPDEPVRKFRYRLELRKDGTVEIENRAHTTVTLAPDGRTSINLTVPEEAPRQLRYRVDLQKDGTVEIENRPGSTVTLTPDGRMTLQNAVEGIPQASITLTPNGDIVLTPGPLGRILLGGVAAVLPVARVGDAAPGVIAPNTNIKVFTV